jgi:lipoprotein Spr
MRGVDCSGFAGTLYREVYKEPFSGSSADILKYNCKKVKRSSLREGDLVFFRTSGNKKKIPNHMGVYLKNGRFVHASSSKGVTISSLSEPYYLRTWLTGGRVK